MNLSKDKPAIRPKSAVVSRPKGSVVSNPKGKIVIDSSRCKGCGLCIAACPKKHIHLADEPDARGIRAAIQDADHDCTGCGFCYVVCPDVAVTVYRRKGKTE